jgi:hypothetical protein
VLCKKIEISKFKAGAVKIDEKSGIQCWCSAKVKRGPSHWELKLAGAPFNSKKKRVSVLVQHKGAKVDRANGK